ncbi:MAG: anthranilate phosphoribosyltransferase [Betaproteobacteria bacterium]|nr:anthranilate phosphoribosyltransferase [Betaproteobacteria bacterium]
MNPQEALTRVIEHREIFHDEMMSLMRKIMHGELSPTLVAAIIIGLRVKKETIGEIAAAAQVMREFAATVPVADPESVIDIVGTGGDGAHSFNISTASMFVAAAAGVRVAKHGGRAVSSKSGSADVLEALGANIHLTQQQIAECIDTLGIGFMFAPNHHGAMKYVAPIRRELGVRTIFNILGPLLNPAQAPRQILGVFHPDLVGIQIRVLQRLGSKRALTVYGMEGLDEISISGKTIIGELKDGKIEEYTVHPEEFNLPVHDPKVLRAAGPEESKTMLLNALDNRPGPVRDIVAVNAGAAIYVAGQAETLSEGVAQSFETIASGAARGKLEEFVAFTRRFPSSPGHAVGVPPNDSGIPG